MTRETFRPRLNGVFSCAAIFCLLVVSCAGTPVLPGERAILYSNISAEYYAIAEAYYALEKYDKAIEYYLLAGRDKKSRYQIDYKLARSYGMVKKWEQAESLYTGLLAVDPENTNLSLSLAYVCAQGGKYDRARELYAALLLRDEYDISVVQNSILLCLQVDDFAGAENAVALYEKRFPEDRELEAYRQKIKTAREAFDKKQSEEKAVSDGSADGADKPAAQETVLTAETPQPDAKKARP